MKSENGVARAAQPRIMVVEDEGIVAMEIENRLSRLGYGVCAAVASGEKAVEKAVETRPDLILMDIRLKGAMDGVEAARQIRDRLDIPVIYLTAHSDEHTLQRAKVSEPFGYILKPFEERELHTTIEMALYRYKLERKLKESERWLSTTLNSIGDGVIATDGRDYITFMNPVAETLTGWEQADALGRKLTEVFQLVKEEPSIQTEDLRASHPWLISKDGQTRPIEDNAAPIRDEQGNINGRVLVFRDITQRQQVEAAMQKARETAEAASRAKSEFLTNMSHEIRTPLNGVLGMTELLLLETSLSAGQRDYVETIHSSGNTLLRLINDILNFSKIEANKLELEKRPFNLRECLETSLDLLTLQAGEKHLELTYSIEDQTPETLIGDATHLHQILTNLLSNAVKFTDAGEVAVEVKLEDGRMKDERLSASRLHFSVRDTGIGIPQDRWDRLFQSFSQVDGALSRRYGGTGLGLVISKRLSELMGGTMWLESEGLPGRGSTFHFTIQAEAAPDSEQVSLNMPQPKFVGKRLLIVGDNATSRRHLSRQTRSWGMLPQDTAFATEALGWIEQGDPFDAAILDLHMPEMDGLALATKIRQVGSKALPLIMGTPFGQEKKVTLSTGSDFLAVLTKPVKYSNLLDILTDIFAEQSGSETIDEPPPVEAGSAPHSSLRILLAEDNPVNQKVARLFLEIMGYRLDVAVNGREVLNLLARQPYDVLLMDIQMPEMDGLETTARIYQQWPGKQRPWIIALTAHAMEGDREQYLAAGMDDYLCKPIKIKHLEQALQRYQRIRSDSVIGPH